MITTEPSVLSTGDTFQVPCSLISVKGTSALSTGDMTIFSGSFTLTVNLSRDEPNSDNRSLKSATIINQLALAKQHHKIYYDSPSLRVEI